MKKSKEIVELYKVKEDKSKASIIVQGWTRSLRESKNKFFIVINDGSTLENLQIVFNKEKNHKKVLEKLNFGSFIRVEGLLSFTPEREQRIEIIGKNFLKLSSAEKSYPLQKKELKISSLRENSHLKSKTKFFLAVLRIRSSLNKVINDFFYKKKFFYVNTPIITKNDAEGGGESFQIKNQKRFFGKTAFLSVSGQLHEEAMVQGMSKVYNFSPCFRAENSNTTRHLSEFWMIEAEMISSKLSDLIKTIEDLMKFIFKSVLKKCEKEIKFLEEYHSKKITEELENFYKKRIPIVTYQECLKIIEKKQEEEDDFFESKEKIQWGMDYKSEHEKYLCEFFKSPIFIINYPIEQKAFYMKINKDEKTVSAVDLIFPKIGEVIGGSLRENNIDKMKNRISTRKLKKNLSWYLDIRKYGYAETAGFGAGFERILMLITKCENIRDTIHFHNSSKELNF